MDVKKEGTGDFFERVMNQLIKHEGFKLKPYRCSAGKYTIGIGRNLIDKGITRIEALILCRFDIHECIEDLKNIFPYFDKYSESLRRVLIDIRFACGPSGFRKFRRLIKAVKRQDLPKIKAEIFDSKFYRKGGQRGPNLLNILEGRKV